MKLGRCTEGGQPRGKQTQRGAPPERVRGEGSVEEVVCRVEFTRQVKGKELGRVSWS